jgi:lysozyme
MTSAPGVDVSSWQHPGGAPIDWAAVFESGRRFVIIMCSQGTSYVNPTFKDDVEAARGAGLLVGAYHFAQPYANSAEDEAAFALKAVEDVALDLGLSLDMEDYGSLDFPTIGTWSQAWIDVVSAVIRPTGFYTDVNGLNSLIGAPWKASLWLADPSGVYAGPLVPWIRQGAPASIPGIESSCDTDTLTSIRGTNPGPGSGTVLPPKPAPVPDPEPEPKPEPVHPDPNPIGDDVIIPNLSENDPGPDRESDTVKALQGILTGAYGCSVGVNGCDGRFGPDTANGVRAFQAGHDLPVDGIVSAETWAKLLSVS